MSPVCKVAFQFINFLVNILISCSNPNSWYYEVEPNFFLFPRESHLMFLTATDFIDEQINKLIAFKSFDMLRKTSCKSKLLLLWKALNLRRNNYTWFQDISFMVYISYHTEYFYLRCQKKLSLLKRWWLIWNIESI